MGAEPKDFQYMSAHFKSVFALDRLFQFCHQALIEMHTASAFVTDEVMMVFAWFHKFKPAFAVTQINRLHEAKSHQRLERSVYSCEPRRVLFFIAQGAMNILSAAQSVSALQNLKDFFAAFS